MVLGAVLFCGCTKNEFDIEFSLPADVNATYKICYYASDKRGGLQIETAANVAQGKGKLRGVTRNPVAIWLFRGNSELPALVFYAERGDKIEISGNSGDPREWIVKGGGEPNELLAGWYAANGKELKNLQGSGSSDAGSGKINASIGAFVKEHSDSAASLMLMEAYFDSRLDPELFSSLKKILEDSGVLEEYPYMLSRQDSGEEPGGKLNPEDMVVQSYLKNIDTLRLKSGATPHLLYFRRSEDKDAASVRDTLRSLSRWRGDSARMVIAVLTLDSDSTTWALEARRDSLKGVVRAIALKGFADEDVMRLGVGATPWYVVTSGKGRVVYSGPELKKMSEKVRSLKGVKAKAKTEKKKED